MILDWALVFLVIALIAGAFGFGTAAGTATTIAKGLFFLFIVIFAASFIMKLLGKKPPRI